MNNQTVEIVKAELQAIQGLYRNDQVLQARLNRVIRLVSSEADAARPRYTFVQDVEVDR